MLLMACEVIVRIQLKITDMGAVYQLSFSPLPQNSTVQYPSSRVTVKHMMVTVYAVYPPPTSPMYPELSASCVGRSLVMRDVVTLISHRHGDVVAMVLGRVCQP